MLGRSFVRLFMLMSAMPVIMQPGQGKGEPVMEEKGARSPERAVLFIIDGLHPEAPQRLKMENFLALADRGTQVEQTYLIAPYHPRSGEWAKLHTCSIPNPTMMAGTLFLRPEHKMIQHVFPEGGTTVHITNARSYDSLSRGFTEAHTGLGGDEDAIKLAIERLTSDEWDFMLVHLQDTGTNGYWCGRTRRPQPGKRNIWEENSRYINAALEADRLLGQFVDALREAGLLDSTLMVLSSDHGMVSSGGHPALLPEGWVVPLVFAGPMVNRGLEIDQAEHTDLIPTICDLLGLPAPYSGPGAGRPIPGVRLGSEPEPAEGPPLTLEINRTLREFRLLAAEALLTINQYPERALFIEEAEVVFYRIDRFLDWPEAGSLESILDVNRRINDDLRLIIEGKTPPVRPDTPGV